jgi:2-polyprenyl-3-methyl-5-hydroxy-6-metoxy-1,4-benzoquinol methylase
MAMKYRNLFPALLSRKSRTPEAAKDSPRLIDGMDQPIQTQLSPADVVDGYQAILGREPENGQVIEHHQELGDRIALLVALVRSAEFQSRLNAFRRQDNGIKIEELDQVAADFERGDGDRWRGRSLTLPNWFDTTLDPLGSDYSRQMLRLWETITGRQGYDPLRNEDTPEIAELDAIYKPAFYASGDSQFAGAQLMAMGHIIMRSGIRPGDRVLEYGAGFGQTALALARLGASVDTVDVNAHFCNAVATAAARYSVDLKPHVGQFGLNPSGIANAYSLIFFYESFHHCIDFKEFISKLPMLLKESGRIILAGEPIFDHLCPELPYLWGFRLDWENVAVMRIRGWLELGFQKNFLLSLFDQSGFRCNHYHDPNSHWAQVYEFQRRL